MTRRPRRTAAVGMTVLVTFPAGLSEVVADCLAVDLPGTTVIHRDESALLITCRATTEQVARLPYLKNCYEVVLQVPRTALSRAAGMMAQRLPQGSVSALRGVRQFRVMAQLDGQLTALDRGARLTLERALAQATGGSVNARGGTGAEFWLVGRRDLDVMILGRRHAQPRAKTPAGALGTELSHLLVRLSQPQAGDVFLDPFAGSGALGAARATLAARRILCSDLQQVPQLRGVESFTADARDLPSLSDGSVDAIVTDPPWGEHQDARGAIPEESLDDLYRDVIANLVRVLNPQSGRMVLLVTRRLADQTSALLEAQGLASPHHHELLVNGHPATALAARMSGSARDRA